MLSRAFDHICMEKARHKFLIIIIIIIIIIMHAASLHYLTHITNVWGCMEILPLHCGARSVKVNYYGCMMKI